MRLDKLHGFGPWFAFASPLLLILACITALLASAVAVAAYGPGSPSPPVVNPAWIGVGTVSATLILGLSVLSLFMVALDVAWIEQTQTKRSLKYTGPLAAAASVLAYLLLLLGLQFHAGEGVYLATGVLLIAGVGTCLLLVNFSGRGGRLFGQALPWIGIVAGCLFLLMALSILVGFGGGAAAAFLAAVPFYAVWSVWLGFRLRGRSPALAAIGDSASTQ